MAKGFVTSTGHDARFTRLKSGMSIRGVSVAGGVGLDGEVAAQLRASGLSDEARAVSAARRRLTSSRPAS